MEHLGSSGSNLAWTLWDRARRAPSVTALFNPDDELTYGALCARAAGCAITLAEAGVQPGQRVGVFLERSFDAAAAYFGTIAAGAVAVVVNETVRPRQIEHVLRHCSAQALVTSAEMLERQPRALDVTARILDVRRLPQSAVWTPVDRAPSDMAQVIYTSGSTGLPKGVVHSHGNLGRAIAICVRYLGISAADRLAAFLPFSSVYGLNQLLSAVAAGGALILDRSPVPSQAVKTLRERGATVLAAVPPLWMQLLAAPAFTDEPLATLRQVQNAGGHLPPELVRRIRQCQPQAELVLQYGMTEVVRSTFLSPEEVDARPDCMGKAIPETEIMVLREDLTPCAAGEVGELVHRGPTIGLGYLDDPDSTGHTFRPFPFGDPDATERVVFSGDMVRRDEDGFHYFVSRRDRMIKTLGFRVGPDEILDALYASGQVAEAQITTQPDPQRGERILAHVVLADGGDLKALERFCRTELPRYMHPSRYLEHAALPKTPNGKHDIPALHAVAAQDVSAAPPL